MLNIFSIELVKKSQITERKVFIMENYTNDLNMTIWTKEIQMRHYFFYQTGND